MHAVLLAIIIVAIAIVVYIAAVCGWFSELPRTARRLTDSGVWMANLVDTPDDVYHRSDGTLDAAAEIALRRATGRREPTPAEHLLAATILTRNVVAQEHRLLPTERRGAFPAADLERSRLRQEAFNRARDHYLGALRGAHRALRARHTPRRGVPAGNAPPPGNATLGFLVDAAADWAAVGLATAVRNDPIIAEFVGFDPGEIQLQQLLLIDIPLAQAATQTRADLIASRRMAAAASAHDAPTGAKTAEAYLKLATNNTSDEQNSHDTAVNASLRAIVKRLREEQREEELPTLDEFKAEVLKIVAREDPHRVDDVGAVIDRARQGEVNTAVGISDAEAHRRVWARSRDPRNAANADAIRSALAQLLFDCWKSGIGGRHIICVNGRTARSLSALDPLDFDPRNHGIARVEMHKNEIFRGADKLIGEFARETAKNGAPAEQKVAARYLAMSKAELDALGELPSESDTNAFNAKLREAIARFVDDAVDKINAATPGAITPPIADGIRTEATAAV